MRRVDALAFFGLFLLFAGAGTFLSKYDFLPLWVVWLVGPLLWYLGFAVLISWMLWRLFVPAVGTVREENEGKEENTQTVRVSNFLEHDYEYDPTEPKMRKVPVYSTLVLFILLFSLFLSHAYAADKPAAWFSSTCAMDHGLNRPSKAAPGAQLNLRKPAASATRGAAGGRGAL